MTGFKTIHLKDKSYPRLLKEIHDPPEVLYIKGEIKPEDELALAVVGTRKCTSYGEEVTERLVGDLVAYGLTIVSGMALGIDAVAHQTALRCGGRTIAVLGTGIDIIYPAENKSLARRIVQNGAILSEFDPGTEAAPWTFPRRNRIISGLSLGVLVVEAPEQSGALITANLASEQNREVFAVPGPTFSEASVGTLKLIQQGAKLVRTVDDILAELNLEARRGAAEARKVIPESPEEEAILKLLKTEPRSVDFLVRESKLGASAVLATLSTMEITGKVRNLGGQVYRIAS